MNQCLTCGNRQLVVRGRIFHDRPTLVAGVEAEMGDAPYHLLGCPKCGAMQKDPQPSQAELMRCYRAAASDNWGADVDVEARQIGLLSGILRRRQPRGGRLLDIGCANGAIAVAVDGPWTRAGIEPSRAAAVAAEERGVNIIAASVDEASCDEPFDAILALDLVEHLDAPLVFMAKMRTLLRTGGSLLILTGDTDAESWRLFGSRHWYCSLAEHIVFFNEQSMNRLASRTGFNIEEVVRIPHLKMRWRQRLNQSTRVGLWRLTGALRGLGIRRLRRWSLEHRSPYWNSACDHMVVVMTAV